MADDDCVFCFTTAETEAVATTDIMAASQTRVVIQHASQALANLNFRLTSETYTSSCTCSSHIRVLTDIPYLLFKVCQTLQYIVHTNIHTVIQNKYDYQTDNITIYLTMNCIRPTIP